MDMEIKIGSCSECKKDWTAYCKSNEEYQEYLEQREELRGKVLICPRCFNNQMKIISFPKKIINQKN